MAAGFHQARQAYMTGRITLPRWVTECRLSQRAIRVQVPQLGSKCNNSRPQNPSPATSHERQTTAACMSAPPSTGCRYGHNSMLRCVLDTVKGVQHKPRPKLPTSNFLEAQQFPHGPTEAQQRKTPTKSLVTAPQLHAFCAAPFNSLCVTAPCGMFQDQV
jgi:hypothetical protein